MIREIVLLVGSERELEIGKGSALEIGSGSD